MTAEMDTLLDQWRAEWPRALELWSRFVQLHEPIWCTTPNQEKAEGLVGSFAMIRLVDHSVVISLRQVTELGLQRFAREILAHEIGHHVLCPADLTDNARLLSRIRRGLPGLESYAPMISNLYSDLMINDRLQRSEELDIAGVYKQIGAAAGTSLWLFYTRIYEILWNLPPQTLAVGTIDPRMNQDAQLGARLVRSYAHDWLGGGGRFACLCYSYAEKDKEESLKSWRVWCDAVCAGSNGIPEGLAEADEGEEDEILHPAEDPELTGIPISAAAGRGRVRSEDSGHKSVKESRGPFEYGELLRATGLNLDARTLAAKYYKEKALPHLIPFPTQKARQSVDPLPEGLDTWDVSDPLERIDWWATLLTSPDVVPGITTRERLMGDSPGADPEKIPIDLYLGVDCSGSMRDPATFISYPILAGAVMVLSALRAGARVKVVLSGEPGECVSTDGFIRDPQACLNVMTNYLGTGYAFGIHRLAETFNDESKFQRPVHVIVISDSDMFTMLNEKGSGRIGWDIARETLPICTGGATYVLQIPGAKDKQGQFTDKRLQRMTDDGWNVHLVDSMEELVAFARRFSRNQYAAGVSA